MFLNVEEQIATFAIRKIVRELTQSQFKLRIVRNNVPTEPTNIIGIAQQDTMGDAPFGADGGGFDGARLIPLRQNDTFAGPSRPFGERITKRRRRKTSGMLCGGAQGINPFGVAIDKDGRILVSRCDNKIAIY